MGRLYVSLGRLDSSCFWAESSRPFFILRLIREQCAAEVLGSGFQRKLDGHGRALPFDALAAVRSAVRLGDCQRRAADFNWAMA